LRDIKRRYVIKEQELESIEAYFKFEKVAVTPEQVVDIAFITKLILNDPEYMFLKGGVRTSLDKIIKKNEEKEVNKKKEDKEFKNYLDELFQQNIKNEKALKDIQDFIKKPKSTEDTNLVFVQRGRTIFELDDTLIIKELVQLLNKMIEERNITLPQIGGLPSNRYLKELSNGFFEYLINELKIPLTKSIKTSTKHHVLTGKLLSSCHLEMTEKEYEKNVYVGWESKKIEDKKNPL